MRASVPDPIVSINGVGGWLFGRSTKGGVSPNLSHLTLGSTRGHEQVDLRETGPNSLAIQVSRIEWSEGRVTNRTSSIRRVLAFAKVRHFLVFVNGVPADQSAS